MRHFPQWSWTLCSLPARYFSWRVRSNALTWALGHREVMAANYDLVFTTSMADLAVLKGLVPSLAQTPCVVYCHENQFTFPVTSNAHPSVEPMMVNLYTLLAADKILFNSRYNLESCIEGLQKLLRRFPDQVPPQIAREIVDKSAVLPVPVEPLVDTVEGRKVDWKATEGSIKVVWSGRHEYDKGPDLLLAILQQAKQRGIDARFAILGQQFQRSPPQFKQIETEFEDFVVSFGYAEQKDYVRWLHTADVFLSTAKHEFQGIAAIQAALAGCKPVLPNRLVYPEWAPSECLYGSENSTTEEDALQAISLIEHHQTLPTLDLKEFVWEELEPSYQSLLEGAKSEQPVR